MKGKGSFGIPEEMMEQINESKRRAKESESVNSEETKKEEAEYYDSESIPEDDQETQTDTPEKKDGFKSALTEQAKRDKEDAQLAEHIEKESGINITEDDMWAFIIKGNLTKKDVPIFPGKLHASFKTLTLKEDREIHESLGSLVDSKILESGFKNVNTKLILSKGLVELGKPGALKSIGSNSKEREEELDKMSTLLIERIAQKWNNFTFLVEHKAKQEMKEKKS